MSDFRFGGDYRLNYDHSGQKVSEETDPYAWDEIDWDSVEWVEIEGVEFRQKRTCGEHRGFNPCDQDSFGGSSFSELWCERCDIELDDEWRFCPSCGAEVATPAAS